MSAIRSYHEEVRERLLSFWERREEYGAPIGCVATTYTFDAPFFELECLSRFVGMESDPAEQGAVYLVEREERLSQVYACVLVDAGHVTSLRSLRWHLIPIRVPGGGVLHAKVSLLAWQRHIRVIISSANLTEPGYRRNYEHAAVLDFGPEGVLPLEALRDVLAFLVECRHFGARDGESLGQGPQAGLDQFLSRIRALVETWKQPTWPRGKKRIAFVPILPGQASLLDRLITGMWWGTGPSQVWVVSPFFNKSPGAARLVDALVKEMGVHGQRELHFVTTGRRLSDGTVELDLPDVLAEPRMRRITHHFCRVRESDEAEDARALHAKSVWLQRGDRAVFSVGSSNFTLAGMGVGSGPTNIEANVAYSLPDVGDSFARKCLKSYPPFEEIDTESTRIRFVTEPDLETPDPEAFVPLPSAFGEALFKPTPDGGELCLFIAKTSTQFVVRWEERALLTFDEWMVGGAESPIVVQWRESRPPSAVFVEWVASNEESRVSIWPVNVTDTAHLPPPEELRDLPLELLVEILTSALPLHIAWQRAQRTLDRSRSNGGPQETDPHKKVDARNFLVRRVRRVSAALEGLRSRMERPLFNVDALQWRLHGPVGPVQFARKLAAEEGDGAAFMIAEVALTLKRVDWSRAEGILGVEVVHTEVRQVLRELQQLAEHHSAPPNLRRYVDRAMAEAIQ